MATTKKCSSPSEKNSQSTALTYKRTWSQKMWIMIMTLNPQKSFIVQTLPVCYNVLKLEEHLGCHIKFIYSWVDGIEARSSLTQHVSIGNSKKDSLSNLKHFPVCSPKCLEKLKIYVQKERLGLVIIRVTLVGNASTNIKAVARNIYG